jgi:hypothetical protein
MHDEAAIKLFTHHFIIFATILRAQVLPRRVPLKTEHRDLLRQGVILPQSIVSLRVLLNRTRHRRRGRVAGHMMC